MARKINKSRFRKNKRVRRVRSVKRRRGGAEHKLNIEYYFSKPGRYNHWTN